MSTERQLLIESLEKITEMEHTIAELEIATAEIEDSEEVIANLNSKIKDLEFSLEERDKSLNNILEEREELVIQHATADADADMARKELEEENRKLKHEIKYVKENVKKPATIGQYDPIQIFSDIKEGNGCIKELQPSNKRWKKYHTYPFTMELGTMGVIYEYNQLKGFFERKGHNRSYYYIDSCTTHVTKEVVTQLLGCIDETAYECQVCTPTSSKKGKQFQYMGFDKILKRNPCFNTKKQMFVSDKNTQYVYQKPDGTKFTLNCDGEEEII